MQGETRPTPRRLALAATRIWLPLVIAMAGGVLIILGHGSVSTRSDPRSLEAAIGVGLLLVALIVWLVNWLFRLSVRSNQDREVEERAREYFDRHGHWPDEEA